jgi:hypothetical protein
MQGFGLPNEFELSVRGGMFLFALFDKVDAGLSRGSNCAFQPMYRFVKIVYQNLWIPAARHFGPALQPSTPARTSLCSYDSASGWRLRST